MKAQINQAGDRKGVKKMYNRKKIAQARAIGYAVREKKMKKRIDHIRDVMGGNTLLVDAYEIARHSAKYQAWCRRAGEQPRRECL